MLLTWTILLVLDQFGSDRVPAAASGLGNLTTHHLQLQKYKVVEDGRVVRHMRLQEVDPCNFHAFQLGRSCDGNVLGESTENTILS